MMKLSGQESLKSKQNHSEYLHFCQEDGPEGLFTVGVFTG